MNAICRFLPRNKKIFFILILVLLLNFLTLFSSAFAGQADDFVITVQVPVGDEYFTIPTNGSWYNYNVDCNNDGTDEAIGVTGDYICDYTSLGGAGKYTIRIKDNAGDKTGFERIYFNGGTDSEKLLAINQWGTGKWTSMESAFEGCVNLNSATAVNNGGGVVPDWATDAPDLSNVSDISFMFANTHIFNQPLNNWDVSNVENMENVFDHAYSFNQPLNNWDVSNVITMYDLFYEAHSFNQPLNDWNVSSVEYMTFLFDHAYSFNQPLNNWDTSSVINMVGMFDNATDFNQNINNWDVSNVTNFADMFLNAVSFNQPLNNWDVSNATDISGMFQDAHSFNQPLNNWNVSSVINMEHLFHNAFVFNQNINNWDVSKVTNMQSVFDGASSYNQPLNNWNTSSVVNMLYTFVNATSFDKNLSSWNVSKVTNMSGIFQNSGLTTENYDNTLIGWNALPSLQHNVVLHSSAHYCSSEAQRQNLINTYNWSFYDAGKHCVLPSDDFVITVKTDNSGSTSNTQFKIPTNYYLTYNYNVDCDNDGVNDATGITTDYICNYSSAGTYTIRIKDNVGDKTGFPRIFFNNTGDKDKILSVNQWGTGKWTAMLYSFFGCSNLNSATAVNNGGGAVPDWATDAPDLSQAVSMTGMFQSATSFNQPLNNWDVSNIQFMKGVFNTAVLFNQPLNNWDVSKVTNFEYMFGWASSFNQPLNNWDTSSVKYAKGMFSGATSFNQPLNNWDVTNVQNMESMFDNATSFNQPLNNWDIANVTNMWGMFSGATSFNQPLNNWDVSNISRLEYLFNGATSFDQDLSSWNVSNVTKMNGIFQNSGLSTENYDNTLIGWNNLASLKNNVRLDSSAHYCNSETQRQNIITTYNWTINDAGKHCFVLDPPTVAPDMTAATDSGFYSDDNYTNYTKPHFVGTCENGVTVTLYKQGTTNIGNQVCAGGSYDIVPENDFADGGYGVTITFNKDGYPETAMSPTLNIEIDTTPANPDEAPDLKDSSDTGSSNTDNLTSDTTPSFDGVCTSGDKVFLYANQTEVAQQICPVSGHYDLTSSELTDGQYSFQTKFQDKAGNISTIFSPALIVNINTSGLYCVGNSRISGWAWSGNIGWISLSCKDFATDINYGVTVNGSGKLSGYAWSDNIGWIDFGAYSSGADEAKIENGKLKGFVKAISADQDPTDGWDGKISLSGNSPDYGVTVNDSTDELEGWAWGSDVINWISFNCKDLGICATKSDYKGFYSQFSLTFSADHGLIDTDKIPYDGSVILSWKTDGADSCTASDGNGTTWTNNNPKSAGYPNASTELIQNLKQDTDFTITCTNAGGHSVTSTIKILVKKAPPILNFTIGPLENNVRYKNVVSGTNETLNWKGENVTNCKDQSNNPKANEGSFDTGTLTNLHNYYTIECDAVNLAEYPDGISKQVLIDVEKLDVRFYVKPQRIHYYGNIILNWDTMYANSCIAPEDTDKNNVPDPAEDSEYWNKKVDSGNGHHQFESEKVKGTEYKATLHCEGGNGQVFDKTLNIKVGKNIKYIDK